jgi:mRNA interferase RelE/StbE
VAYTIRILKPAARELARLDKETGRRVARRIKWLAQNADKMKLEGLTGELAGLFKLREDDYRIVYQVLRHEKAIVIHSIGHRREVYRRK